MRVVIEALSARLGGGQTYLRNLLRCDLPRGMEVFLIAPKELSLPHLGRGVERLPVGDRLDNPMLRLAWSHVALPKILRRLNADVLFAPGGALLGRAPPRCRTVTMFRNMIPFDPVQLGRYGLRYQRARLLLLRRVLARSMSRADLVIFISEYGRSIIRASGVRVQRGVVIPHGVDPRFRLVAPGVSAPSGVTAEFIVYVSILDMYKHQVEVVRAYAALLRSRPTTREKLLLIGSAYPPYERQVRTEVERWGLGDKVVLGGAIPNEALPDIYQNAKLIVFASESENCPNILLEGMASGRPMLSSSFPPMPEFGGDAVCYFDPRSAPELTERMATLLDDPRRADALGAAAHQRSLGFDWKVTAQKTWSAIADLNPRAPGDETLARRNRVST